MLYSDRLKWPLLCLTLACAVLAGCEVFNGDDDDDDVSGSERIGQSDSGAGGVPSTANRVQEGRGELSYKAEDDGTVYLYDADARTHLDTQRVRRGQRYTIDPTRSIATLDGKTVWDRTMNPRHTHRLYFDRERD